MSGQSAVILNENQRRHFEVLLANLEGLLVRVESLLEPPDENAARLSVIVDDVPEVFRNSAKPLLHELRQSVTELARHLALNPRRVSAWRSISATLTTAAIRAEDGMSSQLRGFGAVDPSVAELVDPVLEDMSRTLFRLAGTLRDRSHPPHRE